MERRRKSLAYVLRLTQISILAAGLILLGSPNGEAVTNACYDSCVIDDSGDPGCAEGGASFTGSSCELWEDWSFYGEIMLDAGCDEYWCGEYIAD